MIYFSNPVYPSPDTWRAVVRGMRNPKNSWEKIDSCRCLPFGFNDEDIEHCSFKDCTYYIKSEDGEFSACEAKYRMPFGGFILGKNDRKLMKLLCQAGSPEHAKFLRQLPIIIDITAPLYWWKQMDQYKIGTVTNSCSTMHKLTEKEFEPEDFSLNYTKRVSIEDCKQNEELDEVVAFEDQYVDLEWYFNVYVVRLLNALREAYFRTGDKKYWYAINEFLPHSYMQKRTWSANYEVLRNICKQRKGHPLQEWSDFIEFVHDSVPFSKQLIFNEWEDTE